MKLSILILDGILSCFMSPHDDERQAKLSSRGSKKTKTDSASSAPLPLAPISPLLPKEGVPTSPFPPPNPPSSKASRRCFIQCESSKCVLIPMTGPEMLFVPCSSASLPGTGIFHSSAVVGQETMESEGSSMHADTRGLSAVLRRTKGWHCRLAEQALIQRARVRVRGDGSRRALLSGRELPSHGYTARRRRGHRERSGR